MNLKHRRLESGLKQQKIAEELGITRNQYYYIENAICSINEYKAEKLAAIFRCSKKDIYESWEEKKNENSSKKRIGLDFTNEKIKERVC